MLARQQTLKASIDWSHDLLEAPEKAALRRLGVFSGPFTMDAAESLVSSFGDVDRHDVFDLVDHLADKSLIAMDEVDEAGESRYRLLETIRHYALDRLTDAYEVTSARDAHAVVLGDLGRVPQHASRHQQRHSQRGRLQQGEPVRCGTMGLRNRPICCSR